MPRGPESSTNAQTWALGSYLSYAIATPVSSSDSCCTDLLAALVAWTSDLCCGPGPWVDLRFMLSSLVSSSSWQDPRADMQPHPVKNSWTAQLCLKMLGQCLLARMLPVLGSPLLWLVFRTRINPGKYWNSSTFQHFLHHRNWWGCKVKKN